MAKNQGVIFCRGVPARVILLSAHRSSAGHGAGAAPRRVAARAAWPPLRMGAGEGAGRVAKYNCIAVDKLGAKRTEPSRNHPGIIGSCVRIAKYDLAVADKPHAKRTEPSRNHPGTIGSCGRNANEGSRNHPEPSAEPSCFSESSTRNTVFMASSRLQLKF